jgi:uncharacterized SAM-binding protein YcdF (DUF218 family)
MARVFYFVCSPDGALVVFLAAAIVGWTRPRSIATRRLVLLAAVIYATASTYAVPAALTRLWTISYRPFQGSDVSRRPTAVVLLAAGELQIVGWSDRMSLMSDVEAARVLEAWRVFKLISPDWIVSSGGRPPSDALADPSSTVMRDALVSLGVPPARILLESSSIDTRDQAVLTAPLLRSRGVEQVVVVTSDVHMPRSMGAFRAVGINAIPAVAPDPGAFKPWLRRFHPTAAGLNLTSALVHELLGVPYYWSRGWWRS